jgi:hypothetical protein
VKPLDSREVRKHRRDTVRISLYMSLFCGFMAGFFPNAWIVFAVIWVLGMAEAVRTYLDPERDRASRELGY